MADPTYMWSDANGIMLANMTADAKGVLIASGDVKTGNGDSVSAMATEIRMLTDNNTDLTAQLGAAKATIESLQAQITQLNSYLILPAAFPTNAYPLPRGTSGSTVFYHQQQRSYACRTLPVASYPVTYNECYALAQGQYSRWASARGWQPSVSFSSWAPGCVRHNNHNFENGESGGGDIRWNTHSGSPDAWWNPDTLSGENLHSLYMGPVCKTVV